MNSTQQYTIRRAKLYFLSPKYPSPYHSPLHNTTTFITINNTPPKYPLYNTTMNTNTLIVKNDPETIRHEGSLYIKLKALNFFGKQFCRTPPPPFKHSFFSGPIKSTLQLSDNQTKSIYLYISILHNNYYRKI